MMGILPKTVRILDRIVVLASWPGRVVAWLSLAIVILSVLSVLAGIFRVHVFFQWASPIFLFGTEFNSTSLVELQWHLFAMMMLFAGSFTFAADKHVRVDIFYSHMSQKMKLLVNSLGDLLFLLPFAICVILYSLNLVQFSYLINESSSEMGLTHRWVVKSILPVAMSLLAIQAACRGIGGFIRIIGLYLNIPVDTPAEEENR